MGLRRKPGGNEYKCTFEFSINSLIESVRRIQTCFVAFIMKQNEKNNIYGFNFWLKEGALSLRKESGLGV